MPTRARLPLLAQITGAIALMAAFTMPGFSEVTPVPPPVADAAPLAAPAPFAAPVAAVSPEEPARPAHLNLDFRHSFRRVDVTVTVDDKRALDTRLEGAGRKFGVFGKRGERSFTRSLDLEPGVRVVRVRVRSDDDKLDHTRVERFDLGSAAVATMRIGVDKTGLDVMVDRPQAPAAELAPAASEARAAATSVSGAAPAVPAVTQSGAVAELYNTLRQVLMALAGFIASVASGFLFEEYLRSRNVAAFVTKESDQPADRPERRRPRRSPNDSSIGIDAGLS